MIKVKTFTVAALIAFSCLAFTAGCEHTRGSGTGGTTGTGTGGTIDTGTMDQGQSTPDTDTETGGTTGNGGGTGSTGGSGAGY